MGFYLRLLTVAAITFAGAQALGEPLPQDSTTSASSSSEKGSELKQLYGLLETARGLGAGRFRKIVDDFIRLGSQSQEEVLDTVKTRMKIEEAARDYRDAKEPALKKKLREEIESLVTKDFDAQLKRSHDRAKALLEEAKLLDEEAAKRKDRRQAMIQDKLKQVLNEREDWDL